MSMNLKATQKGLLLFGHEQVKMQQEHDRFKTDVGRAIDRNAIAQRKMGYDIQALNDQASDVGQRGDYLQAESDQHKGRLADYDDWRSKLNKTNRAKDVLTASTLAVSAGSYIYNKYKHRNDEQEARELRQAVEMLKTQKTEPKDTPPSGMRSATPWVSDHNLQISMVFLAVLTLAANWVPRT